MSAKKILIVFACVMGLSVIMTYADVDQSSDAYHYKLNPDQADVCITGGSPTAYYILNFSSQYQGQGLFISKKTTGARESFVQAAIGNEVVGITNAVLYDNSGQGANCGLYNSCQYGPAYNIQSSCPGGSANRDCRSPCDGRTQCGYSC